MQRDWHIGGRDGSLQIKALRGGTVTEISTFLRDAEDAYNALFLFNNQVSSLRYGRKHFRRFLEPEELFLTAGFGLMSNSFFAETGTDKESILPEYRLELTRVVIRSPGFWEFLGGLNPLQQLREYLKDRHERRKDMEFRECSEKKRLELENELLQRQILEKENSVLRGQLEIMREYGFDDGEIRQVVWRNLGPPLARLGQHQDTGLIEGPVNPNVDKFD